MLEHIKLRIKLLKDDLGICNSDARYGDNPYNDFRQTRFTGNMCLRPTSLIWTVLRHPRTL